MKTKLIEWNEVKDVYAPNEKEHEHDFYDGICKDCGWDLREAEDFLNE